MKDPKLAAQKWAQNLSGATDRMKAGAMRVTVAPTELAARNEKGYLAGVQKAVQNGKWRRRLQATSLSDWQQSYVNKGLNNLANGVTAAEPKTEQFLQQLMTAQESMKSQLPARGDKAQNRARMDKWFDLMSQFQYRK